MRTAVVAVDWLLPDLFGGAYRVAWESAQALEQLGWNVRVIGMAPPQTDEGEADVGGLRCLRYRPAPHVPFPPVAHALGLARQLAQAKWARDIDLLHSHTILPGLATVSAFRARHHLHTVHSPAGEEAKVNASGQRRSWPSSLLRPFILDSLERYLCSRADAIHTLSEFTRSLLPSGVRSRVEVVPWWASITALRQRPEDRVETRRELGVSDNEVMVLSVRRLVPRMGLDFLLRGAAALPPGGPFRLVIAGDGPERGRLEQVGRDLLADGRLKFLGRVPDSMLERLYAAADAFALPTRALECFGIIAVEAMVSGVPVVASATGALPEVLAHHPVNLLVRDHLSPDAWRDALAQIVQRGPRSPDEALAQWAKARYSRERTVDGMRKARLWSA